MARIPDFEAEIVRDLGRLNRSTTTTTARRSRPLR